MSKVLKVEYDVKVDGKSIEKIDGVDKIGKWVSEKLNAHAVGYAEEFGKDLATADKPLTASQIRNVFGEVRRIQMKMMDNWETVESSVLLLRPKLAYSAKRASAKAGRNEIHVADKLNAVLSEGLKAVSEGANEQDKKRRFQNFADFFEAVLAYHKASGGKD